jgi:DNA invertase Pin-like site-specific DNA recombinase
VKYAYLRISTKEQSETRQLEAVLEAGVPRENIFIDKASGKNFNRAEYQKLKETVKPGSVIYFHELDRLGRNYEEGKKEVDYFMNNNIGLQILDMPFLAELINHDDLFMRFMGYQQVLTTLFIADRERQKILKRTREGIKIAKRDSPWKYKGRKKLYTPENAKMNQAIKQYNEGEYTVEQICKLNDISKPSLYRRLKELGIQKENDNLRGRPQRYSKNSKKLQYAIELYQKAENSVKDICEITGISKATLYRKLKELKLEEMEAAE